MSTRYISVDRLSEFLAELQKKYANNTLQTATSTDGKYQVNYAHNADQATKDGAGNTITSYYATKTAFEALDADAIKTINITVPSGISAGIESKGTYTLDLSDVALKSEIAAALHFRGVVATEAALPSSNVEVGDLYIVTTDTAGDSNSEFVCTANTPSVTWEKLGPTKDFSGFVLKKTQYYHADAQTSANSYGEIATFDSYGDVIGTGVSEKMLSNGTVASGNGSFVTGGQVATVTDALDARLDTLEGDIVTDVKIQIDSATPESIVSGHIATIPTTASVTESSPKLVQSGAVYNAIGALENVYSKVVEDNGTTQIKILQEATAAEITALFS